MSNIGFSFSLSPMSSRRLRKSKTSKPSTPLFIGVVFIDENANYFVRVNTTYKDYKDYKLNLKDLSCKNREIVWKFDNKGNGFVIWIRDLNNLCELTYHWKPFKPGTVVKGHINELDEFEIFKIKYDFIEEFDKENIEKTSVLSASTIDAAKQFYKDNIKIIKENYKKLYGTAK